MEILFHYGKSQNKTMTDIFDELMEYLCSSPMSQWNLKNNAKGFIELKKEEFKNHSLGNHTDPEHFYSLTGC